jgi:hypothetical protein
MNRLYQHNFNYVTGWKIRLTTGLNEMAQSQGLSRVSKVQITNLSKLVDKLHNFPARLNHYEEIKKNFERSFAPDDNFQDDCDSEKHSTF